MAGLHYAVDEYRWVCPTGRCVFVVLSTIYRFQTDGQPLFENEIDYVVLESFLVFVAYSNMKMRREKADFKFTELFKIIYSMWTIHDTEDEK